MSRRWWLLAVPLVVLALACSGKPASTGHPVTGPSTAPPAKPASHTPTTAEVALAVKILSKQCFGSAGCNVTYRIEVAYTGAPLETGRVYEVTYEVAGLSDPATNTFRLHEATAEVEEEELGQTKRSADKITATVTAVSEVPA